MRPPVEKAMPRMPGSQGLKACATSSTSAALPGGRCDSLSASHANVSSRHTARTRPCTESYSGCMHLALWQDMCLMNECMSMTALHQDASQTDRWKVTQQAQGSVPYRKPS